MFRALGGFGGLVALDSFLVLLVGGPGVNKGSGDPLMKGFKRITPWCRYST